MSTPAQPNTQQYTQHVAAAPGGVYYDPRWYTHYIVPPNGASQYTQGTSYPVHYATATTANYPSPSYDYYSTSTVPLKSSENKPLPPSRPNKRPPPRRSKAFGGFFPSRSSSANTVPKVESTPVVRSPLPQYPMHYQQGYALPYQYTYLYPWMATALQQQVQQAAAAAQQQQAGTTPVSKDRQQQQQSQSTPIIKADPPQRRPSTPAAPILPEPGTPDTFTAQPPPVVTLKIPHTDTEDEPDDEPSSVTPHLSPLQPPEIIITNETGESSAANLPSPVDPHNVALPLSPPRSSSPAMRGSSPRPTPPVMPSIAGTMAAVSLGPTPNPPHAESDEHRMRPFHQAPSLADASKSSSSQPIIPAGTAPSDSEVETLNAAVQAARQEHRHDLPIWMRQDGNKGTALPSRRSRTASSHNINGAPILPGNHSNSEMGPPSSRRTVGRSRTLPYEPVEGSFLFQPPVSTTPTPPDEDDHVPEPSPAPASSSTTRRIGPFPFGIPKFVGRFGFGRKAPPAAPIIPIIPELSEESPVVQTRASADQSMQVKKGKWRSVIPTLEEDDRPPSLTPSEVTTSTVTIPTPTSSRSAQYQQHLAQQQGLQDHHYQQDHQKSKPTAIIPDNIPPSSPEVETPPTRHRRHRKYTPITDSTLGFSQSREANSNPPPPPLKIYFGASSEPYYGFSIASPYTVYFNNRLYSTAEHLYHAFKFIPAKVGRRVGSGNGFMGVGRNEALRIAEAVRNAGPRGLDAWLAAKAYDAWIRPDWEDIKVDKMEEVLYLKFTQHRELREELISTYPAQLMWGTKRDAFFGIGPDGDGRNELGKLLMSVRERLKDEGGYDISDSS